MASYETFVPYRILEVELGEPLPELSPSPIHAGGQAAERAMILVRLHTHPIGVVELDLDLAGVSSDRLAEVIWQALREPICQHMAGDGFGCVERMGGEGLPASDYLPCLADRDRLYQNPPFVSVLVATRDRADTLARCLDSLLASDYPNFEIIVIDNAPSSDETARMIETQYAGSGCVRYVREDRPGLAVAHNCGLRATDAPFIAITDDDVTVDRYWLSEIMLAFQLADKVGCVTGTIFPSEIKTRAQYWIERAAGYTKGFTRRVYNLTDHRPAHPLFPYAAGMFGSGANMSFRTEALLEVGGFDDALGVGTVAKGGDDLASFFEIIVHGWTLVYNPAAIVYHRHYREYERLRRIAYGYGAGLTAYLTRVLANHPGRIVDIARRVPHGLHHALSPGSAKNARKAADYPAELTWIERRGMLAGPFLYLRSRWKR